MSNKIEIDLSTLIFLHVCGDAALFVDADGDEILFRATGNRYDNEAAARELHRAAKELEG